MSQQSRHKSGRAKRGRSLPVLTGRARAKKRVTYRPVRDKAEWERLRRELCDADARLREAEAALSTAEHRYSSIGDEREKRRSPRWLVAARRAEASAADLVEQISLQIAGRRARSRAELRLKMQLLAAAYGENRDIPGRESEADRVSRLIRSLITDLAATDES